MCLITRAACRPSSWRVLMWMLATASAPCLAQAGPAPAQANAPAQISEPATEHAQDPGPMVVQIDLDRLLFDARASRFQDPVWRLTANKGKRILLLPFTVENVHNVSKLLRFPITVRTGRLIGFVIPKPEQSGGSGDALELSKVVRASPDALEQLLFGQPDESEVSGDPEEGGDAASDSDDAQAVPDNAPRLAREITLHPDGTVRWAMDRSFHTGEPQRASEQNLYAYKIDPEQLRAAQPERAERITRQDGEDKRDYNDRKREEQLAQREKQQAYRALRDSLRDLPESFREPVPAVMYAAIEVPDSEALSLQGPAPLPWTFDEEKKKLLNDLSRGGSALQQEAGEGDLAQIIKMVQGHPLDAQAVALAVTRGGLAGKVQANDLGYEVLSSLLTSADPTARRIALYGVARVVPPTLASAQLIGVAGQAALGEERKMLSFVSLSKLFATQANDPEQAPALADQLNRAIADPQGPASPRIIEQVLGSLATDPNARQAQPNQAAVEIIVTAIDLSGVTDGEVAGVARSIIQHAPANPVAAGWLDLKLLGSDRQAVVDQALALLEKTTIDLTPEQLEPEQPDIEQAVADQPDQPEQPAEDDAQSLTLSAMIPMTRPGHALLGLLDSDDGVRSARAWRVLDRFNVALPKAPEDVTPTPAADEQPPDANLVLFEAVLAKAAALEKAPPSVVDFIVHQTHPSVVSVASDRLIGLLQDAAQDQAVAAAAASHYIADPQRYAEALKALASLQKQGVVASLYRAQGQPAPLMAGLVADSGQTLDWWIAYLAKERALPTAEAWQTLAIKRGESSLLQIAASADQVVAPAAAAALVVTAGGGVQQEQAFAQAVALMQERTRELVEKEWVEQRGEIFAAAYKRVQGTYQLVVTLGQAGDEAAAEPGKRIDLGLVELRAEGLSLSLSVESIALSSSPGQLGIRIDKPASLRVMNNVELSELPLDRLKQPIDLLPQDGGAWSGEASLPGGQTLGVSLEPAG